MEAFFDALNDAPTRAAADDMVREFVATFPFGDDPNAALEEVCYGMLMNGGYRAAMLPLVEACLAHGADPNRRMMFGSAALHFVMEFDWPALYDLVRAYGGRGHGQLGSMVSSPYWMGFAPRYLHGLIADLCPDLPDDDEARATALLREVIESEPMRIAVEACLALGANPSVVREPWLTHDFDTYQGAARAAVHDMWAPFYAERDAIRARLEPLYVARERARALAVAHSMRGRMPSDIAHCIARIARGAEPP